MSSSAVGDEFEGAIYELFRAEIEADNFWAKTECCQVFRKKGYHSKDRGKAIVFDVSIEIRLPGQADYSMLMLVECKKYAGTVPVDDIEEFFAKVQQVAAANVKAVVASTSAFQSGSRSYAKSKGMGLIRYFDSKHFKWDLLRSPSAGADATDAEVDHQVEAGISTEEFASTIYDLYMQSPLRTTNSLRKFIEDHVIDLGIAPEVSDALANPARRPGSRVPFVEKEHLESRADAVVAQIAYSGNEVDLVQVCEIERRRCGLQVHIGTLPAPVAGGRTILGKIRFHPLVIHVFSQPEESKGRDRFTLAHELAHHLLGHVSHMAGESCEEADFALQGHGRVSGTDISRMEFQANYFAASLLMPRGSFVREFRALVRSISVPNRGFGLLYLDDQPCNQRNYEFVTSRLMQRYGVSRAAARIRLEGLGLLHDVRTAVDSRLVQSILAAGD